MIFCVYMMTKSVWKLLISKGIKSLTHMLRIMNEIKNVINL